MLGCIIPARALGTSIYKARSQSFLMPGGKIDHNEGHILLMFGWLLSDAHTELTADDTILSRQTWCQVDVSPLHTAQALLLDGAPIAHVGTMNSLCRAVCRTSQDWLQLQIQYLATTRQPTWTQNLNGSTLAVFQTILSSNTDRLTKLPVKKLTVVKTLLWNLTYVREDV